MSDKLKVKVATNDDIVSFIFTDEVGKYKTEEIIDHIKIPTAKLLEILQTYYDEDDGIVKPIELDADTLKSLIKGTGVSYSGFNHPLVVKAGFSYSDQYGSCRWDNLRSMSYRELHELYVICRESWNR